MCYAQVMISKLHICYYFVQFMLLIQLTLPFTNIVNSLY